MLQDELEYIKSLNDLELVKYFQDGLVARATGNFFEDDLFKTIKLNLINKTEINDLLPNWIKRQNTIDQYWTFIKGRFGTYQERREFLWEEFRQLISYLETKSTSPIDTIVSFDEAHIHSQWQKALDRKQVEPEGAITAARTLIESILKHILDEQRIEYDDGIDLPELYKQVAKSLNLAPEQHQEQIFKQILGGVSSVVSGLGALRNKLGDAHGKSKRNIKPSDRHSEFAVNLAGAVSIFLFRTLKETKS